MLSLKTLMVLSFLASTLTSDPLDLDGHDSHQVYSATYRRKTLHIVEISRDARTSPTSDHSSKVIDA